MELTTSWERVFDEELRRRYVFAEVRSAAATLRATNPDAFEDLAQVLSNFALNVDCLVDPQGNKGDVALNLDLAFRELGWREAAETSEMRLTFTLQPYRKAGETKSEVRVATSAASGHKVDNVLGRAALEVEWHAKDGALDRDLANFRALYEAGLIDAGVIVTRHHERTKYAANRLAELANRIRYKDGKRIIVFPTTTTTNIEKLTPRMERGDGGGCPVLAIGFTELCYKPGPRDPALPPFEGPIAVQGVPEEPDESEA